MLAYFGRWVPGEELRRVCGVNRDGSNAADVARAARSYGLEARGWECVRRRSAGRGDVRLPAVLFWGFNHDFVVLEGFGRVGACITSTIRLSDGGRSDGRDLANLDRRAVRRRIGVVTQNGALQPGDIHDNIIGFADDLTIDDAWRAARLAAVHEDITAMPMGMFTPVCGSTSTFSGDQTQRIRIAAALVRDPRIVFLDEATNWLDNHNQTKVTTGIKSLTATRIIIAHRLSTIRQADRIYVLEAGRIAQHSTFRELITAKGPFRQLMQRQIA